MVRLPGGRKKGREDGRSRKGRVSSITDFSMFRSMTSQVGVVWSRSRSERHCWSEMWSCMSQFYISSVCVCMCVQGRRRSGKVKRLKK